jgi:MinD superfamily P-loop ATPase
MPRPLQAGLRSWLRMKVRHLKWIPVVAEECCTGCRRCVDACGPGVLEVCDRVAILVRPGFCGSEGHCVPVCPEEAIRMEWSEMEGDQARGRWRSGGRVWPGRVRGG